MPTGAVSALGLVPERCARMVPALFLMRSVSVLARVKVNDAASVPDPLDTV